MDQILCTSANTHVKDQSKTGHVGHEGSDGSSPVDRIKRAGFKGTKMGENIAYGTFTAIDIVADLMIDDGVSDRGHRMAFLDPDIDRVGVAFLKGQKAAYGSICVVHMGKSTQNSAISGQNQDKTNQGSAGGAKGNMKGSDGNANRKKDYNKDLAEGDLSEDETDDDSNDGDDDVNDGDLDDGDFDSDDGDYGDDGGDYGD